MTRIRFNLFPNGREQALTLSYDDSVTENRRFVEIINRGGLKCSFHLNSGVIENGNHLQASEVGSLFEGHEISAHSRTHPHLETLSAEEMAWEILEDRRALEALAGYPVRGMSYPFGTYNDVIVSRLPALGIEYSRTTQSHHGFHVPDDWLRWHPTCHHRENLLEKTDAFIEAPKRNRLRLFYVWGHAYEFERNNNWDLLEAFVEKAGPRMRERSGSRQTSKSTTMSPRCEMSAWRLTAI